MKHTYLQVFLIGILGGVYVNNYLENTLLTSIFFVVSLLVVTSFSLYIRQYRHTQMPLFIGTIIGISISSLTLSFLAKNQEILLPFQFEKQHIHATIVDIHKKTDFSIDYKAKVVSMWNTMLEEQKILTLIRAPLNFSLEPWDTISYESKLYLIENFDAFNYKEYLLSQDIYFRSYASTLNLVSSEDTHALFSWFYQTRESLLSIMEELYPNEEKIFLWGILLGARENIPDDLKTDFNNSWLTHFIAVSGFNITILVIFFGYIFQYFPVWLRSICIVISIVSFTILVGFSAPVVRASIMGLVAYFILMSGRKPVSITVVLFTASCMVLFSPLSLNYDVSFHLSFLAVIGIIYTQEFFKNMFSFLPKTLAIREAFVLTLSALSFTIPIMIFQFGQVSLLAPIANIAVTWTIPIAMLLGFLSLIWYLITPWFGYAIAFLDWIFLKYDILMVHFFGNIDWALIQFDLGVYSIYLQALYFIVLTFLVVIYRQRKKAA